MDSAAPTGSDTTAPTPPRRSADDTPIAVALDPEERRLLDWYGLTLPRMGEDFQPMARPGEGAPVKFVAPEDDPTRKWRGVSIRVVPHIDSAAKAIDMMMSGRWSEPLHPEAKDVDSLGLQRTQVSASFQLPLDGYALLVADGTIQLEGTAYEVATLVHGHVLAEQPK
jgi:hypothetical protein